VDESELSICLLGASFITGNRGVSALACGSVNAIRYAYPNATIFLLDYERVSSTRRVVCSNGVADVELVNIRFSWRIWLRNNIARLLLVALLYRMLPVSAFRRWIRRLHPHLDRVVDAHTVVSIGGGDSFADVYGLARLVYVSLPQLLAVFLGRPLIQLPQTIGPFDGRLAKMIARLILRSSDQVYSRDREGLSFAAGLMSPTQPPPIFAFDMAFALEPAKPASEDLTWFSQSSGRPIVGLNVSGLLCVGGYTGDNMFGLASDYRGLVKHVMSYFLRETNCRVVLIPHAHKGNDPENDTAACEAVLKDWASEYGDRLHYVGDRHNEAEIKYLIGRCDFFVGSRMHACIAALSQAVPAVGLAYSGKFIGIWRSLGVEELVIDLRSVEEPVVLSRLRALFESTTALRVILARKVPEVRRSALSLFSRDVAAEGAR
jgi:colanic acid/amylovoran biosynthesis protein